MKFITKREFTIEVDDDRVIVASIRDFTTEEDEQFKIDTKDQSPEFIFMKSIEDRVSPNEELLQLGQDYGYELIFKTILLDIAEKDAKKKDV